MSTLSNDASANLVEVTELSRSYGQTLALDNVSLQVPRNAVFGLLGVNGAGKTTLIKHIMGLLKAQRGSVRVFGKDPVTQPVEVLSNMGYLSEVNELPDWMRVSELVNYTRSFYPTWDVELAAQLTESFGLQMNKKIKQMSKGQRARVGILLAIAHRPELLVLDEPSSGLDPLVRRDILRAIIRTISHEGRTVLFSSHLLDEVERVADYVAIINAGRVIRCGSVEAIKASYHNVAVCLSDSSDQAPTIDGALAWSGAGRLWTAMVEGDPEEFKYNVSVAGEEIGGIAHPTLDEVFVGLVGENRSARERELVSTSGA